MDSIMEIGVSVFIRVRIVMWCGRLILTLQIIKQIIPVVNICFLMVR